MNNPNPFIPQGSLVEQMNKKRARVKMAVLAIFSGTIVLIAPVLLIQGCKRDQAASDSSTTSDTAQTVDTNTTPNLAAAPMPATADTNASTNNNMGTTMATQPPVTVPPPVAAPVPAPAASTYVIVPHDTYATIAKKFSVKVKDLEAANPTMAANKLKIGSTINIPASGSASTTSAGMASTMETTSSSGEDVYTVKAGDNLTKIAHTSGTTVKALMAMNNLATTRINVGQKLKLPTKTTAASPMETMPAATTTTTASNPTSSGSPVLR